MNDIDRAILDELRRDGRASSEDLARRLHISRPTASRHLNRLIERDGVRVVGVVHPAIQGITVMGHVSVVTDGDPTDLVDELAGLPDVAFLSITAGTMSLVVEIRAHSQQDFQDALDQIRRHRSVVSTNTVLYSEILIDVLEPVRVSAPSLDQVDLRLIESLRRNGRSSYAELAQAGGISVTTARTRVRRLLREQIVRIGVILQRPNEDNLLRFGVGIQLRGLASSLDELVGLPELQLIVTAVGRFDAIVTIDGVTRDQATAMFTRIRALPQVLSVEAWMHLKVCKEQY